MNIFSHLLVVVAAASRFHKRQSNLNSLSSRQTDFSSSSSSSSGLQRYLLHQLFLPVLRQQRVGHDRSALPVWRNQHRLLELPGRVDGGALPL